MGSTAMDKKKDVSSSSSKKSSSHKKLMLRVHIPVSGSSLFPSFGSWRGLGMFFSDMEHSERQGEVFPAELWVWGRLGWGCTPATGESSTSGVGWGAGSWPPVQCWEPGMQCPWHGGVSSLSQFQKWLLLLYKRSCALGCGFGSVCLTQFPLRPAARSSKSSAHPKTLVSTFPGLAPGTVPACGWTSV